MHPWRRITNGQGNTRGDPAQALKNTAADSEFTVDQASGTSSETEILKRVSLIDLPIAQPTTCFSRLSGSPRQTVRHASQTTSDRGRACSAAPVDNGS